MIRYRLNPRLAILVICGLAFGCNGNIEETVDTVKISKADSQTQPTPLRHDKVAEPDEKAVDWKTLAIVAKPASQAFVDSRGNAGGSLALAIDQAVVNQIRGLPSERAKGALEKVVESLVSSVTNKELEEARNHTIHRYVHELNAEKQIFDANLSALAAGANTVGAVVESAKKTPNDNDLRNYFMDGLSSWLKANRARTRADEAFLLADKKRSEAWTGIYAYLRPRTKSPQVSRSPIKLLIAEGSRNPFSPKYDFLKNRGYNSSVSRHLWATNHGTETLQNVILRIKLHSPVEVAYDLNTTATSESIRQLAEDWNDESYFVSTWEPGETLLLATNVRWRARGLVQTVNTEITVLSDQLHVIDQQLFPENLQLFWDATLSRATSLLDAGKYSGAAAALAVLDRLQPYAAQSADSEAQSQLLADLWADQRKMEANDKRLQVLFQESIDATGRWFFGIHTGRIGFEVREVTKEKTRFARGADDVIKARFYDPIAPPQYIELIGKREFSKQIRLHVVRFEAQTGGTKGPDSPPSVQQWYKIGNDLVPVDFLIDPSGTLIGRTIRGDEFEFYSKHDPHIDTKLADLMSRPMPVPQVESAFNRPTSPNRAHLSLLPIQDGISDSRYDNLQENARFLTVTFSPSAAGDQVEAIIPSRKEPHSAWVLHRGNFGRMYYWDAERDKTTKTTGKMTLLTNHHHCLHLKLRFRACFPCV